MSVVMRPVLIECQAMSVPPARAGWLGRVLGTWRERVRERREYAKLDRRDLLDLGLSRWQVEGEMAKPFWRG